MESITVWGKSPESTGMVVVWRTSLELRVFFQILRKKSRMQMQLLPTSDVGSGCSFSCRSFPTLHRRGDVLWFPCQFIQMYLKSMKMHPTAFGSYSIKDPRTWNKQLSPEKSELNHPDLHNLLNCNKHIWESEFQRATQSELPGARKSSENGLAERKCGAPWFFKIYMKYK